MNLSILLIVFVVGSLSAQKDSTEKKRKHRLFELSFGQSLLFIPDSRLDSIRKNYSIIVPTNAILFLAELRPNKRFRVPLFFNLPTGAKQYLINGSLVYQKASITFGTGLQYKVFQFHFDSRSKVEFEIGPLASFIFNTRNDIKVAPVLAGRFRLTQGENFTMYLGCSYSFGIKALGLLYGTGTVF